MATTMHMQLPPEAGQMYDPLNAELGISNANLPEGLHHHFATKTDDGGLLIFDVWESRAHFERFANEQLMPAMQKVAGDQAPQMEPSFGELHNEFHAG
jgi:hypothetical protein